MELKLIEELGKILSILNCKVNTFKNTVMFYDKEEFLYPEDYVVIKFFEDNFEVYEVHRSYEKLGVKTNKAGDAIVFATVLWGKFKGVGDFFGKFDEESARNIKLLIEKGDIDGAKDFLSEKFTEDTYSLISEEENKVSLVVKGDKVDVKFHGKYIVKDYELSKGYYVLYNYTKKLTEISYIYNLLKLKIDFSYNKNELEDLYIFGLTSKKIKKY